MRLQSFVSGDLAERRRARGSCPARRQHRRRVAEAASEGSISRRCCVTRAESGGPRLRAMTFHERAAMLRALGKRLFDFKSGVLRALARHRRDQG